MKIAIDALNISQPGGGRSATLNLLEPLLRIDQESEYLIVVEQAEPSLAQFPHVRQIVAPTQQRLAVRLWAQATLPGLLRRERVELIHHTKNLTTALLPCPAVVTVHDLTILVHPEIYPALDVAYWRTIERYSLRRIERIIAVSRVTAHDLVEWYDIAPGRISVIYEGIDDVFGPVAAERVAAVGARYGLPADYILHVGSISPKKNLSTLARAYGRLVESGTFAGPLVLVGRSYWPEGDAELDACVRGMTQGGRIIRTGAVPQEDLPALYAGCSVFAFPSLHEGFGLVPLEAMACGAPVVASKVGALPEVIGEVAVFVEQPTDEEALAERLAEVLNDSVLRERLKQEGMALGRRFSRERAARETLALYRELVAG